MPKLIDPLESQKRESLLTIQIVEWAFSLWQNLSKKATDDPTVFLSQSVEYQMPPYLKLSKLWKCRPVNCDLRRLFDDLNVSVPT